MPNANYLKGRRKEYKEVRAAKDAGLIAFRSAGSHSPIDVCVIDTEAKQITMIQCKPDLMSENMKNRIALKWAHIQGTYEVTYVVR